MTHLKDFEEKLSYPDPIYGMRMENQPAVGTATQLHSQEKGNGQTHNIINRADNQGKRYDKLYQHLSFTTNSNKH